jgi:hypothetical protein
MTGENLRAWRAEEKARKNIVREAHMQRQADIVARMTEITGVPFYGFTQVGVVGLTLDAAEAWLAEQESS